MTFSDQFQRTRGKPIDVDGRPVFAILRREMRPGDRCRLTWRQSIDVPLQGIRLRTSEGTLGVDGKELQDVVLWRDTAPREVEFVCNAEQAVELRVWNCWRDDRGTMQAWIGNAGMRLTEVDNNQLTAECNSRSQVTFNDLVFDLFFEPSQK